MPLAQHQSITIRVERHGRIHVQNVEVEGSQDVDHGHLAADVAGPGFKDGLKVSPADPIRDLAQLRGVHLWIRIFMRA